MRVSEKHPTAWAWRLERSYLCRWAEPLKERLTARSKPSDGAVPIRVRLVPLADYREMAKALEGDDE